QRGKGEYANPEEQGIQRREEEGAPPHRGHGAYRGEYGYEVDGEVARARHHDEVAEEADDPPAVIAQPPAGARDDRREARREAADPGAGDGTGSPGEDDELR